MKKVLSAIIIISLLLLSSCAAKTEKEDVASYYKNENLTEAEKFVNENKLFPDEYIGSFDTDSPLERREFATVLYKLAGEPDVENEYKLIQTDTNAFYYDACMFTACNDMTLDVKFKAPDGGFLVQAGKTEAPKSTVTYYIDDVKIPYAEVVYGLYNYAKYAGFDCETGADSDIVRNWTSEIDLLNTPCFKECFEDISSVYHSSMYRQIPLELNDYYTWAASVGIIEANENGRYETESEITHAEFAEIMQRFYANVLNA